MSEGSLSAAAPAPAGRRRRLALPKSRRSLAAAAGVLILIVAGVIGGWFMWSGPPAGEVVIEIGAPLVYRPFPELLADLKPNSGERIHHVRLTMVAQVPDSALKTIEQKEPEIMAQVQAYLRELERRELVGQAGSDRLRRDVLAIINAMIAPARAQNLLFTQFLLD